MTGITREQAERLMLAVERQAELLESIAATLAPKKRYRTKEAKTDGKKG